MSSFCHLYESLPKRMRQGLECEGMQHSIRLAEVNDNEMDEVMVESGYTIDEATFATHRLLLVDLVSAARRTSSQSKRVYTA
jgi:hypothetical protein